MRSQQQRAGLPSPGPVLLSQYAVAAVKSHAIGRLEQRRNKQKLSGQLPEPMHPAALTYVCAASWRLLCCRPVASAA